MTTQLTGFRQDLLGSWIPKDPAADLTYSIDWVDWIYGGDSIATSTWAIDAIAGDPAGTALRIQDTGITSAKTFVNMDRGTLGEIYTVKNTITTTNGLIDVRRFRIKIENRYL